MKKLLNTVDQISEWSGRIVSYFLPIVMLVISSQIVCRFFGAPQIWSFETAIYFAGASYVLGGAYTLLKDGHVKMDILYMRFSPRTRAILDLITAPGFFCFCGILLYYGAIRGWESFLLKEIFYSVWSPVIWPIKLIIPLGGLLILLQGLAKFIRDFHMVVRGRMLD